MQIRVEREACAQIQNLRTHGGHSGLALVDQAADERADLAHFVLAHAAGRDGRRAETHATRDAHGLRVERDGVFIGGDVRRIQQILHLRASAAAAVDVGQHEVVVRAAGDKAHTALLVVIDGLILLMAIFVFTIGGFKLAVSASREFSALLGIPRSLVYSIAPISGVFIVLAQIINIYEDVTGEKVESKEGADK